MTKVVVVNRKEDDETIRVKDTRNGDWIRWQNVVCVVVVTYDNKLKIFQSIETGSTWTEPPAEAVVDARIDKVKVVIG